MTKAAKDIKVGDQIKLGPSHFVRVRGVEHLGEVVLLKLEDRSVARGFSADRILEVQTSNSNVLTR